MEYYPCPICKEPEKMLLRYPNMVCSNCLQSGIWSDKEQTQQIQFMNTGFSGGFTSIINNNYVKQHTCYIKGHECYADEARFGGIIIQCFDTDEFTDIRLEDKQPRKIRKISNNHLE
jgi:hypothetical protein